MSYEIRKDVPIPPAVRKASKYPFPQMEVGDSFLVPLDDASAKNVSSAAYCWARHHKLPAKFAVRTYAEGSICWRIA